MDDDGRLRTSQRPQPGPLATADTALCPQQGRLQPGPGGRHWRTAEAPHPSLPLGLSVYSH